MIILLSIIAVIISDQHQKQHNVDANDFQLGPAVDRALITSWF